MYYTRNVAPKLLVDAEYKPRSTIPAGQLPLEKTIIELMLYLLEPQHAGFSKLSVKDASWMLAWALMDHWNLCNIYTVTVSIFS